MTLPKLWVVGVAGLGVILMVAAGLLLLQPPGALIQEAGFSAERITPNADQRDDITEFRYRLHTSAKVTLVFEQTAGQRFVFRDAQRRVPGDYRVLFSGVVEGYKLPGETGFRVPGEAEADPTLPLVETRLMPDGLYTWTLTAETDDGETDTARGTLEIAQADIELPLIQALRWAAASLRPTRMALRTA
ncbi:MAG: hypothetical protein HC927_00245 [Deltaproteobacteria bacterium]|nr:hypothetical protein [Deltaproteobacteria bacterium]